MNGFSNPVVRSKNSVDTRALVKNIGDNLDIIKDWMVPCNPHPYHGLIVSGGSSTLKHIERIRKFKEDGGLIFCIKHSLPTLINNGIIPDVCVVLDPRPNFAPSTHGMIRKDLYNEATPEMGILFLVASMTNPTVTNLLLEKGLKVMGWHAMVDGIQLYKDRVPFAIQLGTCSAMRSWGILKTLGFSHIELVGFDSDVPEPTDSEKREVTVEGPAKYIPYNVLTTGNEVKTFWTTGELVAQIQDIEQITRMFHNETHLDMWEGGLGYEIFQTTKNSLIKKIDIESMIR